TVRLWDVGSGKERLSIAAGGRVTGLAFSPDGKTLAGAGTGLTVIAGLNCADSAPVRLWDVDTGKEKAAPGPHRMTVRFPPDGRPLVAAGYRIREAGPGEPAGVRINMVGVKSHSQTVLWDADTGRERLSLAESGYVVALSADGRFLATVRGTERHFN